MIKFKDGEFEIAIATYKRPEYIEAWLEKCYQPCVDRNIRISIYDSSPDNATEEAVKFFNKAKKKQVYYRHVDENTIIGYKPMIPIMESEAKYLWVSGDSRYHKFGELDEKVFPHVKKGTFDYIVINVPNNYQLPDTVYEEDGKMLHDVFVASTCIGLSIYRTAIFDPIKRNAELMKAYDCKFKDNFGFSWLGYFYNVYALGEYKTLLANIDILPILNKKKKQSWAVRFYGCWADDLCQIIDYIPKSYIGKEAIPINTWKVMGLESVSYGYLARKYGDLNTGKYKELEQNGTIERITDRPKRIKFFATAPMAAIEGVKLLYDAKKLGKRAVKKFGRIMSRRKSR